MSTNEISISDVLADPLKNFCNIYDNSSNENDVPSSPLQDNEYYTESEFIDFVEASNFSNIDNVTILSINIANLLSKLRSLKLLINNLSSKGNKPDILVIVETHISNLEHAGLDKAGLNNILPGYVFFHKGRINMKGGGVGVFISCDINSEPQLCKISERKIKFVEREFENVVVRIPGCIEQMNNSLKRDLIIVAIYRQPNYGNVESFLSNIESLLHILDKAGNELVIAGDMNLDLLKYETHPPTAKYLDIMTNHQLLPRIVRPTRIKNQSATLIDHIFTCDVPMTLVSGVLDVEIAGNSGFTDHKSIFTILRAKVPKSEKSKEFTVSFFTKEGHIKRREGLCIHDWSEVMNETDPDRIYNEVVSTYSHYYTANISHKVIKRNSNKFRREPWMTNEILSDIRRRDRLSKLKDRRDEYKKIRNEVVSKTRKAQRDFLQREIRENLGNIKKHWQILRMSINKTNNKQDVTSDFLYKGKWITDSQTNAECMNQYLANIGKDTNESVGSARCSSGDYLKKHIKKNEISILTSEVSMDEVTEVCRNLNPKKSIDPSGFRQNIVIHDAGILAPVLTHLINRSIVSGVCPQKSYSSL